MHWTELARALGPAWGCWSPPLSSDGSRVAYVSDRNGTPQLWVQSADDHDTARLITLSDDPVVAVRWSADDEWLACAVATNGGVRSEIWLVRPDGAAAHRVAGGGNEHAS